MKRWEAFEIDCTKYLNKKFGKYAKFTRQGGADSTVSDILVETMTRDHFYIEAKMPTAQCGQFVLLPDFEKGIFVYSSKSEENEHSEKIRQYMNTNFESFCNATARGKNIELEKDVFYNWIKNYYSSKNAKYIITRKKDYTIIPLCDLDNFFGVSAKYRIKRSGTGNPSKNNEAEIIKILDRLKEKNGCAYQLEYGNSKSRTYVTIDCDLKDRYLKGENNEYIFRKEGNRYYIRRRSTTLNANVIFSIKLKGKVSGLSDKDFINYLQ